MDNRIETRFTRDYGIQHPIAQAPMAFVGTTPDLAIAMYKAGGVGSLAVGPLPAAAVRGLIKAVKAATDGPLNVNFITILANEAQIRACVDESVSVVSFHWGHPPPEFVSDYTLRASRFGNRWARSMPPKRLWIQAST
jgi:NAD(P)H-dependent flavin oxidoreductase YrpB (nitropropane dioxygenase family)